MHNFPSVFEGIEDLNLDQLNGLLSLARKFKGYSSDWQGLPIPFLKTPIVATSFLENSTRTKNSFAVAIKKIGAQYIDFNADSSSLKKGESLEETLYTLNAQGVDLCIIRTSVSHEFSQFKKKAPIKIINGGDGINEHPTQALLDLFTMTEIGLAPAEKTVTIAGDCVHSRVGHSLMKLLPQFGIRIILCGPKNFLPSENLPKGIELSHNIDEAIEQSDLLYLLRIQKERHKGTQVDIIEYTKKFGMTLDRLKKPIPVFHPGPANIGVEISSDLIKSRFYFGHEQVLNSIYMRMAILQAILQNQDKEVGVIFDGRQVSDLA